MSVSTRCRRVLNMRTWVRKLRQTKGIWRCGIGLIIAGSVVTACGDPGADVSSNAGAEYQGGVAAGNEGTLNELVERQPAPEVTGAGNDAPVEPASPCLTQGADRLQVAPIHAVGTEPFWAARVEGRCITYSNPENQQGIRVWTRYSERRNGRSVWVGQLGGKSFEMRVRPEADCSDGMSDKRYPMAVVLIVNGENRVGCAEPL